MRKDHHDHMIEAELEQLPDKMHALAEACTAAARKERERLARDVHDELGQILTALRIKVSLLRAQVGADNRQLMPRIQAITGLIDQAIQSVRNISSNLPPAALDRGIVPAIKQLCAEFSRHMAIPCAVLAKDEDVGLDDTRSLAVFRIVQESLTNVARHAEAGSVEISLARQGETLLLSVCDNGKGFATMDQMKRESAGLAGMRKRAASLGGNFQIVSKQGEGTVVSVRIPIPSVEAL